MPIQSLAPQLRDRGDLVRPTAQSEGEDLSSLVAQTGPLTLDAAAECLQQALELLKNAHDKGIVFGDLRPSDLILDWDGALTMRSDGARFRGRAEPAEDLRRLAEVTRLLLLGDEEPFASGNGHGTNGAAKLRQSLNSRRPGIPETVDQFHARLAHAGSPEGYASAAEALEALLAAQADIEKAAAYEIAEGESDVAGSDIDGEPQPASDVPRPVRRRAAWVVGSVAVTLAAILAAAGYFLWH
ncbi:MAG: hypothetical protein KY475_13920 [Planctomycetes bacterium]|nr:hypothetical protein [Planctomycetota bacterium]